MSFETNTLTTIQVKCPINGKELYSITDPDDATLDRVFATAKAIEPKLRAMTVQQRVEEMLKVNDWVIKNQEFILDRIIEETGKSRLDALAAEVFEVCDVIDHFKKVAPKVLADQKVHTPIVLLGKKSKIVYEPMGTVLLISPWNFPFYQGIIPGLLAFLAGNAVIWKPSEVTPLKGVVEKMVEESGFMKDAIQVVYGGKMTGSKLIDRRPAKVHFTGSVNTGRRIMEQCSKYLIPVDLELGGKDPAIVFDDISIERTVNGIMWGAFTNAGQSCTSIERLYVQDTIHDELVKELVDKTKKLKVSHDNRNYKDPEDCDVGTVTAEFQIKIIESHIQDAVEKGAKVLCGGSREPGKHHFPPTVIVDADHTMKIMTEETFGPVVAVMKFKTEEEAIRLSNDSPYGLGASVWSKDLKRAEKVAKQIITGNVSINSHMLTEANPALPFGGIKDSGFGRYKGDVGLLTFSNSKSILIDTQGSKIEPHWYPFTKTKYSMLTDLMRALFSRSKNWIKFATVGLKIDSIGGKEKIK
ncbi:MAG: aldehyde dehydrogenase family protein [Chitinophagales bacterium]|nr:aldehyde dehydrogenase family protein [Chitinophagales bacterium]